MPLNKGTKPNQTKHSYKKKKIRNIMIMNWIMSKKKITSPPLMNQNWKTLKVKTDNYKWIINTYLNGRNTEFNELISERTWTEIQNLDGKLDWKTNKKCEATSMFWKKEQNSLGFWDTNRSHNSENKSRPGDD